MSATPRNRLSTRDLPATPPCPASRPCGKPSPVTLKRAYGVDVAPDCTIASNGGKQSLYNLFAALLNDGDEVLIPSPYWVSYPDMVYLNGGVPVAVKAPASQGFKVTVEQLEAALTPKAKILVFNSPSNPTGACYSVSERDAIVKWALDRGLFIIADEIYDQLVSSPTSRRASSSGGSSTRTASPSSTALPRASP